jgi:FdhD protein
MQKSGSSAPASPAEPDETQARAVTLDSIDPSGSARRLDFVAREEPLEIQLGPASLAVVMRTPGHDEELTMGFLVTERVVSSAADVVSIRHCSTAPTVEAEDNVIRVTLAAGVEVDLAALRRNLYASSSCGICGKATIENALAVAPPLTGDRSEFRAATIRTYAGELLREQDIFRTTGGLHGAALFDQRGTLLAVREDVGRHNATDKVVGWAAANGRLRLTGHAFRWWPPSRRRRRSRSISPKRRASRWSASCAGKR